MRGSDPLPAACRYKLLPHTDTHTNQICITSQSSARLKIAISCTVLRNDFLILYRGLQDCLRPPPSSLALAFSCTSAMQVFEGFHLFPQQQEFNAPELNIKECNFRLSATHKAWLSQGQMLAQTTKAHGIMGVMSPTCHLSLFWFWKEKRRALDEGVTLHPTNQAEYSAITSIRASISISEYFKLRLKPPLPFPQ